jgi:hypothetical protein
MSNKKPINKEYLISSLKEFDKEILSKKYELTGNNCSNINISKSTNNAIIEKEDGLFVSDQNGRIAGIENKIDTIKEYEKYVNIGLDYGLYHVSNYDGTDKRFQYEIPFDIMVNGNLPVNDDASITLKSGRTYHIQLHLSGSIFYSDDKQAPKYALYSEERGEYISDPVVLIPDNAATDNSNKYWINSCSSSAIYTVTSGIDEHIKVKLFPADNDGSRYIEKLTPNSSLVIMEIGRKVVASSDFEDNIFLQTLKTEAVAACEDRILDGYQTILNDELEWNIFTIPGVINGTFRMKAGDICSGIFDKNFGYSANSYEGINGTMDCIDGKLILKAGKIYMISFAFRFVDPNVGAINMQLWNVTDNKSMVSMGIDTHLAQDQSNKCMIPVCVRPLTDIEIGIKMNTCTNINGYMYTNEVKIDIFQLSIMEIRQPVVTNVQITEEEKAALKQEAITDMKTDNNFLSSVSEVAVSTATETCKEIIKAGYREVVEENICYGNFYNIDRKKNPVRGDEITGNWQVSLNQSPHGELLCDDNGILVKGGKTYSFMLSFSLFDNDNNYPYTQCNMKLKIKETGEEFGDPTIIGPGTSQMSTDRCALPIFYKIKEDCHVIPYISSDPAPCTIAYVAVSVQEIKQPLVTNVEMNYQEYSTEEHIVGKWINGKTLYQKTFVIEVPANENIPDIVSHNLTDVDFIMVDMAVLHNTVTKNYINLDTVSSNEEVEVGIYVNATNIHFTGQNNSSSWIQPRLIIYVTLKYTKITD